MIRNIFAILGNGIKPAIDYVFSIIKFKTRLESFFASFFLLAIICFITRNTEFSIFNDQLTPEKISLWVTVVLSILSNHDENPK
jgi:hypothetical protein